MSRAHAKTKPRHSHDKWPRIAGIGVLVALVLGLSIAGRHWLTLDSLREHRDALQQFVAANYWAALLVLSLITIAQTAISAPFSPFLIILAGMVFGLWVGTASMTIATAVGSVLALLVVRYLVRDFTRARVERHPKAKRMLSAFGRHQESYLLFLRFEPGIPLWLANIIGALANISLLRFSLLTLVGVIPDTFVFANIGANLAKVKSAHELLSPGIILALALLAFLALAPIAIQRWRGRCAAK